METYEESDDYEMSEAENINESVTVANQASEVAYEAMQVARDATMNARSAIEGAQGAIESVGASMATDRALEAAEVANEATEVALDATESLFQLVEHVKSSTKSHKTLLEKLRNGNEKSQKTSQMVFALLFLTLFISGYGVYEVREQKRNFDYYTKTLQEDLMTIVGYMQGMQTSVDSIGEIGMMLDEISNVVQQIAGKNGENIPLANNHNNDDLMPNTMLDKSQLIIPSGMISLGDQLKPLEQRLNKMHKTINQINRKIDTLKKSKGTITKTRRQKAPKPLSVQVEIPEPLEDIPDRYRYIVEDVQMNRRLNDNYVESFP